MRHIGETDSRSWMMEQISSTLYGANVILSGSTGIAELEDACISLTVFGVQSREYSGGKVQSISSPNQTHS